MRPHSKLRNHLVHAKEKVTRIVHQIPCKNCNMVYIGETLRALATGMQEHKDDISRNAKKQYTRATRKESQTRLQQEDCHRSYEHSKSHSWLRQSKNSSERKQQTSEVGKRSTRHQQTHSHHEPRWGQHHHFQHLPFPPDQQLWCHIWPQVKDICPEDAQRNWKHGCKSKFYLIVTL